MLGVRQPEAGGTAAYARAAFGPRAAAVTGWWFLAGVVIGAPAVAMIGGFYVAELLGAGRDAAVVAAAGMIAAVIGANTFGVHATRPAAARARRRARGAAARGGRDRAAGEPRGELDAVRPASAGPRSGPRRACSMLSFIGWETVSHLAGELPDPARQLPRAIFAALAVVAVLYLGLAAATVGVLGTAAPSDVPLADLMAAGLGAPGRTVTAFLAVLLTMGAMNAYVAAATKLAGALAAEGAAPAAAGPAGARARRVRRRRGAAAGAARRRRPQLQGLVRATSASFVSVYVIATAAGVRLLAGPARWCAGAGFAAVIVVLAFSGWLLLVPLAVGVAAHALQTRSCRSRSAVEHLLPDPRPPCRIRVPPVPPDRAIKRRPRRAAGERPVTTRHRAVAARRGARAAT